MSALAHPREVFPLTPEAGRLPSSPASPSAPASRPWALRFARVPDSANATVVPEAFYDPESQVSLTQEGDPITAMGRTETPTVPDGNVPNPPPLDEGAKD